MAGSVVSDSRLRAVLGLAAGNLGPKHVMCVLVLLVRGDAVAPRQQELARALNVSERTVRRVLADLEDAGLLRRRGRRLVLATA